MRSRKKTRKIFVGSVGVGGDSPVSIQSMTNTDTKDVSATLRQVGRLARLGCEIVRVAVPDKDAADALKVIALKSPVPVIADIHFDHRLAIQAIENGVQGIRINPGNIKNHRKLKEIIACAKQGRAVIRIGVNAGSLDHEVRMKYGSGPEALVRSALGYVRFFEENGFDRIKVSLKSTDVLTTVEACERFSRMSRYPQHLGITEAGTERGGTVKSAAGIGHLLMNGIGDTIRVSLTAPPEREVLVAREILQAVGLRSFGPELVSCPTCARREIDVIGIAKKVEKIFPRISSTLTVAVMGCPVNGPGEAMEADIGLAGGKSGGVIFKKGKVIARTGRGDDIVKIFIDEIRKMDRERQSGEIKK